MFTKIMRNKPQINIENNMNSSSPSTPASSQLPDGYAMAGSLAKSELSFHQANVRSTLGILEEYRFSKISKQTKMYVTLRRNLVVKKIQIKFYLN